jgi:cobalt-zinc-cadmium efflux system membrane fusion protein
LQKHFLNQFRQPSRWTLLALTLAVSLFVIGCSSKPKADPHDHAAEAAHDDHAGHDHGSKEAGVELTADASKLAGIKTAIAVLRDISPEISVPGTVNSTTKGKAMVTPPVPGRVISLNVRLGETVKEGQVIGVIESTDLAEAWENIADAEQAQLSAQSAVTEAQAQLALARSEQTAATQNLDRQKKFASAGAFNQAALQEAKRQLISAQSELDAAQKEFEVHTKQYERLKTLYEQDIVSRRELEDSELDIEQDRVRLKSAKSQLKIAEDGVAREQNIARQGLQNSKEVQTAESELAQAKLQVSRALTSVQSAKSAESNARQMINNARSTYRTYTGGAGASIGRVNLTAPISGVVTHMDVTRGQAVDRTQNLLEIENLSSVWVTANVPEKLADTVRVGASVEIQRTKSSLNFIPARVQVVGSRVDEKSRALPVQCVVENTSMLLKPGMFVTVFFQTGTPKTATVVPQSSVILDGDASYVFVKEASGEFHKHVVEVGLRSGGWVEILSGVKAGNTVASEGGFILKSEQQKGELKGHEH